MSTYPIHQFDSFTDTIFGGNPTVTVLNAQTLTDEQMKKIAREMNLSETGFILPSSNPNKADFKLRYFTPPGNEINFCGHATVGALATIAKEKLFGCVPPRKLFKIETNAGILDMEIDLSNPLKPVYIMGLPELQMVSAKYTYKQLSEGLGISEDFIDKSRPIMIDNKNNYLYFAVPNLDSLGSLKLDMELTTKFCEKDKITVICVMTAEARDPKNQIHARGYAPLIGVPEDPFTGSMQGGLAAYAIQHGMVPNNSKWIAAEQGHFIGRPGVVRILVESKEPFHVKLHAEAAHVFSTTLTIK